MKQLLLQSLFTQVEFSKVEKVFNLDKLCYKKVYLKGKFFLKDLLKLKKEISRESFKLFVMNIKDKNVEFEYNRRD